MNKRDTLILSAAVRCFPLWLRKSHRKSISVNIDPATLKLSQDLQQSLANWSAQWESRYQVDDQKDIYREDSEKWENFKQKGRRILKQLEKEVGEKYEITCNEDQVKINHN
ncbi:MAG: hypothetical protein GF364_16505 [Candidatus Lokiarchaeota archaeon]|nr:hypothetical protein [Candidatus Lokiarchaeota archaeon]